ncbi:MAG: SDR family oxidoreductase [Alphaproteobacteria bacterium]|nr:SDR family oxidoreductase [Alphaproteobacteria bacterium]
MSAPGAVLVTGAGRRLGAALAEGLAGAGFAVFVHYNGSREPAEAVCARIRAAGGRAEAVAGDLSDPSVPAGLIERCSALRPLTALVNSASVFDYDRWDTVTGEGAARQMQVNAFAPVLLAQAFARALPADGRGAIVNILDQKLWNLHPDFFSYTLSKTALWCATQMLAQALAPRIRVNAVAPGLTLRSGAQTEADFEAMRVRNPLERPNQPGDILQAVLYLLAAEAVTGQALKVDGGEHLKRPDPEFLASKRPKFSDD